MYSIDTKGGQSGSPVYVKVHEDIQLLGIHKAYNNLYKLNTAVFITTELITLIKQWAQ
jgi:V8-like Glu-specific endopeptidase